MAQESRKVIKSTKEENSKKEMKISYVLPTMDRAEYLGECLLTLTEQNFDKEEFEIIVVDDGSTDSTPELMAYFLKNHSNIRYYKHKHQGVERARNFGNQVAKADIIAVCDSDDIYHEDRTKLTWNYFKKHPKVDIMNGSYIEISHNGLPVKSYMAESIKPKVFFKGNMTFFCHDNCAYRKTKILKTPYRPKGPQTDDWKLIHDWLKAGYKFGFIKKELCKVRTLNIGIMGSRRKKLGVTLPHAQ